MKVAFDVYAPPEGVDKSLPPVILLHGRLDSKKTWEKLAPLIARETCRKVYAYDARNHGESPWVDRMDLESLSNDLDQFLNDHAIQKAVLVGHSMGGSTAIKFTLQKPEKVAKLFVEDMVTGSFPPQAKDAVLQVMSWMKNSLSAIPAGAEERAAKEAVFQFMSSLMSSGSSPGFLYDMSTLALKKVEDGYAWQANIDVLEKAARNRPVDAFSGTYYGDTLFLYGNRSFFDVEKDESVFQYFPGALKVAVEGAGHLIHQDHPQEFLKEVVKFILNPS